MVKLGYAATTGGSRHIVKHRASEMNLDVSHFTGRNPDQRKCSGAAYWKEPLEYWLKRDCLVRVDLKKKLFEAGLKDRRCEWCKLDTWLDKPMPLELDHIDGDRLNNTLENLRILCPNCHAQTPTYKSKNRRARSTMVV